jgi:NAD(P)H dehydrogenase (quinone)
MTASRSVKVLVCFASRYGSTALLADAIAEGVRTHPGDQVLVRCVAELEAENVIRQDERWWQAHQQLNQRYSEPLEADLSWADAVILGSPSYFGNMAASLKQWLERVILRWRSNEIEEKVGAAFCTSSTLHGGNETTILSMIVTLMHLGFVIAPTGYLYPVLATNQSPYGASAVTGASDDVPPTEADLAAARALGYRVSHVARCLVAGHAEEDYRRRRASEGSVRPTA